MAPVSPPKGSIFSRSTLYPFLLFTALTSLALNLAQSKSDHTRSRDHLLAQLSVLDSILARLEYLKQDKGKGRMMPKLSEVELERIERELELVQLGRGKGSAVEGMGNVERGGREGVKEVIGWGEALFGKKRKEFEPEQDDTDWEKVFQEADAREKQRNMPGYLKEPALPLVPPLPSSTPPKRFIAPEPAPTVDADEERTPKRPSSKSKSTFYL